MVDNEGFLSKISEGEVKISSFFLSSSPWTSPELMDTPNS